LIQLNFPTYIEIMKAIPNFNLTQVPIAESNSTF